MLSSTSRMSDSNCSSELTALFLAAIAIIGITDGFTFRPPLIFPGLMQHGHPSSSLFTFPPTQDYLNSLSTKEEDDDDANSKNFWGSPRNEREIIDFISEAVFNEVSHLEAASSALNDDVAPTIDQHLRRIEVISEEPPLVIVHGFLAAAHCDDIMKAVVTPPPGETNSIEGTNIKNQLRRSTMGVAQNKSEQRTSSTAWLHQEHCPKPLEAFSGRVSALSGIPTNNFENLQVVRYQPGQEFQVHTDHLDTFNEMACGGRLATCLLYLNDSEDTMSEVSNGNRSDEAFTGGETFFHQFNTAVSPRKGSALFWWNTIERPGSSNYDKNMFLNVDLKLRHAGLPVLTGEKWICNKWVHPLPFPHGV